MYIKVGAILNCNWSSE